MFVLFVVSNPYIATLGPRITLLRVFSYEDLSTTMTSLKRIRVTVSTAREGDRESSDQF